MTNAPDKVPDLNDVLPKKTAAVELIRVLRAANTTAYIGVAGAFIVAVISVLSIAGASISAAVISVLMVYFIFRNTKEMNYYHEKYDIPKPKRDLPK